MNLDMLQILLEPVLVVNGSKVSFANEAFLELTEFNLAEVVDKELDKFLDSSSLSYSLQSEHLIETRTGEQKLCTIKKCYLGPDSDLINFRDVSIEFRLQKRYQTKIKELQSINSNLDQLVVEKSNKLTAANRKTSFIISSLGLAFFIIDLDGKIDQKSSQNLGLLGNSITSIFDLDFEDMNHSQIKQWLELLKSNQNSRQDLLEIAPEKFKKDNRYFKITFSFEEDSTEAQTLSLGIAVEDITKQVRLEVSDQATKINSQALIRILPNLETYPLTLEECQSYFKSLQGLETIFDKKKRQLHALKGIFSYYGPKDLFDKIHDIETLEINSKIFFEELTQAKKRFDEFLVFLENVLPSSSGHATATFDIETLLTQHLKWFNDLSMSYNKKVLIEKSSTPLLVPKALYSCLSQFLIHSLRNAIAHALFESTKSITPTLTINQSNGDTFKIEILANGYISKTVQDAKLSGNKEGMKLMDELAQEFKGKVELHLDATNELSVTTLTLPSIPLKLPH